MKTPSIQWWLISHIESPGSWVLIKQWMVHPTTIKVVESAMVDYGFNHENPDSPKAYTGDKPLSVLTVLERDG